MKTYNCVTRAQCENRHLPEKSEQTTKLRRDCVCFVGANFENKQHFGKIIKIVCFLKKTTTCFFQQISRTNEQKLNESESTVSALPFKPSQAKSDSFPQKTYQM